MGINIKEDDIFSNNSSQHFFEARRISSHNSEIEIIEVDAQFHYLIKCDWDLSSFSREVTQDKIILSAVKKLLEDKRIYNLVISIEKLACDTLIILKKTTIINLDVIPGFNVTEIILDSKTKNITDLTLDLNQATLSSESGVITVIAPHFTPVLEAEEKSSSFSPK